MCVLLPSGETRNYVNIRKERSRLWDHSPGVQQHTTVESAAALKIQDKKEGKYDDNIHNINGQYSNEMYKRAENMVPQLDGIYNVSDDLHSYLDLASSNIIAHRM